MGSLSEYGRSAGAVHSLRSRLPTLWSKSYFVASVGRVSNATIPGYITQQTTHHPTRGAP